MSGSDKASNCIVNIIRYATLQVLHQSMGVSLEEQVTLCIPIAAQALRTASLSVTQGFCHVVIGIMLV